MRNWVAYLSLKRRCHGNKFSSFSDIFRQTGRDFCIAQSPFVRFVSDCRIVADLMEICCTACREVVLGIRFVADVMDFFLLIWYKRYDSKNRTNGIWHARRCALYTSSRLFDHQLAMHSWRTRENIVYDARVDQIFTAWRYMHSSYIIFWHAVSRKRLEICIYFPWNKRNGKLRLLSIGTILMILDDPHTNIPNFYRATLC